MNEILGMDNKVRISSGNYIKAINFDNAATTPPFNNILVKITKYAEIYGSIGRGTGYKSEMTTKIYKECREYILNYFNASDKFTAVFVNNTTDGINKLSKSLIKDKEDVVISSRMEHHSNDIPWRKKCRVDYIDIDKNGRLLLSELEDKLIAYNGRVKYVTLTGASNVTGYINDIYSAAKTVHKYNAKIIVDGAQLVPHMKVNISGKTEDEQIDFIAFSGHKIYAPFGCGVVIGLKSVLDNAEPFSEGGGTVKLVTDNDVIYLDSPEKDEAGTPNFFGALSIVEALKNLEQIGLDKIHKKELLLKKTMIEGLKSIKGIECYADTENFQDSVGTLVFNFKNITDEYAAILLSKDYGISIRMGCFCAHTYCRRLLNLSQDEVKKTFDKDESIVGMIRASFGIYNEIDEVYRFLDAVNEISSKYKGG